MTAFCMQLAALGAPPANEMSADAVSDVKQAHHLYWQLQLVWWGLRASSTTTPGSAAILSSAWRRHHAFLKGLSHKSATVELPWARATHVCGNQCVATSHSCEVGDP